MPMVFPPVSPVLAGLPLLIHGVGIEHPQEPIRRPDGYPFWQWIQVQSGRMAFEDTSGRYELGPGQGLFLPPHQPHSYHSVASGLVVDWLTFQARDLPAMVEGSPLAQGGAFGVLDPGELRLIIREAWRHANAWGVNEASMTALAVYRLVLCLLVQAHKPGNEAPQTLHLRLQPVLEFMDAQIHRPLSLEDMARVILVSPAHLSRLFRRQLGQSPLAYLIELRIQRARSLLLGRPELRIHEIAALVGYDDESYFTRIFRSRLGMSPRAYRDLHGYN